MAKKKICPKCGEATKTVWSGPGRVLQDKCVDWNDMGSDPCGWEGKPYTPPKKSIKTTKNVPVEHGSCHYELLDNYGHVSCHSEGFPSKKAAVKAAEKAVAGCKRVFADSNGEKGKGHEKSKAVVWPPTAQVTGVLIE